MPSFFKVELFVKLYPRVKFFSLKYEPSLTQGLIVYDYNQNDP